MPITNGRYVAPVCNRSSSFHERDRIGGLIGLAVSRYYMNFPWAEMWVFIPSLLDAAYGHELSASDLARPVGRYITLVLSAIHAALVKAIVVEERETLPERLQWPYGNDAGESLAIMREHELSSFRREARAFWAKTNAQSNWDRVDYVGNVQQ